MQSSGSRNIFGNLDWQGSAANQEGKYLGIYWGRGGNDYLKSASKSCRKV